MRYTFAVFALAVVGVFAFSLEVRAGSLFTVIDINSVSNHFDPPQVNDSGTVAFAALGNPEPFSLYTGSGGPITTIATPNNNSPQSTRLARSPSRAFSQGAAAAYTRGTEVR